MALHDYSGARLKELRRRARLTQDQASKLTGVCANTLYRVEAGRVRPQTKTLDRLHNLYAIRIQQIRNQEGFFKERFSGGYIPSEAVIGFGSIDGPVRGNAKKVSHEQQVPASYGV